MNVVVTSGGTIAPIDDVRHLANFSTGRFGASIAEAALMAGAHVWYIHTPAALLPFARLARLDLDADFSLEALRLQQLQANWLRLRNRYHPVRLPTGTLAEYAGALEGVLRGQSMDVAFLAMAASDYAPAPQPGKLSSGSDELTIRCRRLPKVIRSVKAWSPSVYLVGFKLLSNASTAELIRQGRAATLENQADLTVANDLTTVQGDRHVIHLLRPGFEPQTIGPGDSVAATLVDHVLTWASKPRIGVEPDSANQEFPI